MTTKKIDCFFLTNNAKLCCPIKEVGDGIDFGMMLEFLWLVNLAFNVRSHKIVTSRLLDVVQALRWIIQTPKKN